jgi:hypothetical protein
MFQLFAGIDWGGAHHKARSSTQMEERSGTAGSRMTAKASTI